MSLLAVGCAAIGAYRIFATAFATKMCYFMLNLMSISTIKTEMFECEMMADSFNDESVPIRADENVCNFYKFFHENLGLSLGDCVSRLGRLCPFINLRNVRVAHQYTSTCSNREPSTRMCNRNQLRVSV